MANICGGHCSIRLPIRLACIKFIIDEESPLVIKIFIEDDYLVVQNNLQRKNFVETSNKQGLVNLQSLYHYLNNRPVEIQEANNLFTVKIPLL